MELAMRHPALEAERVVSEASTATMASDQAISVPTYTKHIIRVDSRDQVPGHDYTQEKIYFTHASMQGAIDQVQRKSSLLDAILIQPEQDLVNVILLKSLTEIARQKCIPLILYTPKFRQTAKDLAMSIGLDEYHYGAISSSLLKKIEFIKKLKEYKYQRGEKTATVSPNPTADVTNIKIWGLKRAFDIAVSSAGLLVLSPLLVLIAVIIKLESKGPIFYISKRAGSGYKIFNFIKFRSMRVGADNELAKLAHLNQYTGNTKTVCSSRSRTIRALVHLDISCAAPALMRSRSCLMYSLAICRWSEIVRCPCMKLRS